MGGSLAVTGEAIFCEGDDVVGELDRVFAHPGTQPYRDARTHAQLFYEIANGPRKGRWKDLQKAYRALVILKQRFDTE